MTQFGATKEMTPVEKEMVKQGKDLTEPAYQDYFGFDVFHRWYFPDGVQYVEFKEMSEGDRSKYQQKTSKDITLQKATGNAILQIDPGVERKILVFSSVINWSVFRNGQPVAFGNFDERNGLRDDSPFGQWYLRANPKLVDGLVEAIREKNEWLLTDNMTVEAIDEEIASLQEQREKLLAAQAGKKDLS